MINRRESPASMVREPSGVSTPNSEPLSNSWVVVLRDLTRDRFNQVTFIVTVLVVAFAYSMLLTFAYTQRFSISNWQYLDPYLVIWSLVLALGMAVVVVLQVYALRRVAAARPRIGKLGGLAFVGSVLPSMLCCTPVIPTVLAFVGFSTVSVYGTTGTLQYFFATHQSEFFIGSFLLMAITAWWSMQRIITARCFVDGCELGPNERVPDSFDGSLSNSTGVSR